MWQEINMVIFSILKVINEFEKLTFEFTVTEFHYQKKPSKTVCQVKVVWPLYETSALSVLLTLV